MIRETIVMDLMPSPSRQCPPVPVQVEARYDVTDPAAVVLAFRTGRAGWVSWVLGRDLLRRGLYGATGDGDVRVHQADQDHRVEIVLASPSGYALFQADRGRLEEFLDLTEQECPVGAEEYDVDGLLARLLGASS